VGPVNRDLKFRDNKVAEQVNAAASAFAALICRSATIFEQRVRRGNVARASGTADLSRYCPQMTAVFPARGLEQGGRS